ncbi:Helix-turn-helix, AraC domain-containing protein [Gemmatirosa kalamazoonensis]|uniref:Helix-turn-helix, AraC domain-containing protein n=1 Tax=Gemmatirosa kalamazoonensis TaxID=861299 RepID=W0RE66_9BACT|nr:AraC family transcriptional regulator [Gemmatirosa kalamazoonensis]AHG89389.1 Helix-turn-helix, AraC domain-containing protein [Gemmatirosa kalamazoonensis]
MTAPIGIGQFVGAPVRARTFEGVSLAENTYAAGLRVAAHAHDAPLLSLVLQGNATEDVGSRTRELGAQSLLYTPSFETHAHRFLTPGRWLNVQFTAAWFARVGAGERALPKAPQLVRGTAVNWASRIGAELREPDAVSRLAIEGALLLLVSELSRLPGLGEPRRPRWLGVVEDAIEASLTEPPTVADLAALAGVHASHLLRTFRRHHGATVANYARQRRIEQARAAIAQGDRSLSAIALAAGFADQSHFTRVFRRAFGETPGAYARSLRGDALLQDALLRDD